MFWVGRLCFGARRTPGGTHHFPGCQFSKANETSQALCNSCTRSRISSGRSVQNSSHLAKSLPLSGSPIQKIQMEMDVTMHPLHLEPYLKQSNPFKPMSPVRTSARPSSHLPQLQPPKLQSSTLRTATPSPLLRSQMLPQQPIILCTTTNHRQRR